MRSRRMRSTVGRSEEKEDNDNDNHEENYDNQIRGGEKRGAIRRC